MSLVKRKKLPALLRKLFWDYRFASLSWQRDRDLIIQRVLTSGDWQTVCWLRRRLGDTQLREWLLRRRGAGLAPRQLRFWELVLGLPRRRVNSWLTDPARAVWDKRCHRYAPLQPARPWPATKCHLASLDDLATMKLSALSQRGAKKDFVDLYALCRKHTTLSACLKNYQRRFRIQDIGHVLYSLAYFDDADSERMPIMLWKVAWPTIKNAIRAWVAEITR